MNNKPKIKPTIIREDGKILPTYPSPRLNKYPEINIVFFLGILLFFVLVLSIALIINSNI